MPASPSTPEAAPASQQSRRTTYEIGRADGVCAISGHAIAPGEKFFAAVRETPQTIERLDVSLEAWPGFDRSSVLAYWRAQMPKAGEKKKRFIDDAALMSIFEQLAEVDDAPKQNFRFVLALILMRKRLLSFESSTRNVVGQDVWILKVRGSTEQAALLNPHLDDAALADVQQQLSQVLGEQP